MAMPRKISSNSAPLCFFALKVSLAGSGGRPRAIFFRGFINDSSFLTSAGLFQNPGARPKQKFFFRRTFCRIVSESMYTLTRERRHRGYLRCRCRFLLRANFLWRYFVASVYLLALCL